MLGLAWLRAGGQGSLQDILFSASLSTREKKRQGHIYELISTEENYVKDLTLVKEVFYRPMKQSSLLSDDEVRLIFVNWPELIMSNTKMLKSFRVRQRMSENGIIEMIGDILCESVSIDTYFCDYQLAQTQILLTITPFPHRRSCLT